MIWPDPYRSNPDAVFDEMCGNSSNFDPTIRLRTNGDLFCNVAGEINPTALRKTITPAMAANMPKSSLAYALSQQQNKPVAAETAKPAPASALTPAPASDARIVTNVNSPVNATQSSVRMASPASPVSIGGIGGGGGGSVETAKEPEPENETPNTEPVQTDKTKPILIVAGIALVLYLIY